MKFYRPKCYITGEEIRKMNDDEYVLVNRVAINSQIARLTGPTSDGKRKEALKILLIVSSIMSREENKSHRILWGYKMKVRDVKTAFYNRLDDMLKTSFRKV